MVCFIWRLKFLLVSISEPKISITKSCWQDSYMSCQIFSLQKNMPSTVCFVILTQCVVYRWTWAAIHCTTLGDCGAISSYGHKVRFLEILLFEIKVFIFLSLDSLTSYTTCRGKQEGAIISLAIACFLAFQHFSRAGSLQKAFDQSSVLATVAIIGVTVVSFLFLI